MARRLVVGYGLASLAAALVVVLAACGGGNSGPTGASGTDSAQFVTILSGRTGQPVGPVGTTAIPGQPLNLQVAGFFSYRTSFDGKPITLWPADDGFLSAHHTRSLVYNLVDRGRLTRLARGVTSVSLVPDANIRAFPWAMDRVRVAAATLSTAHPALEFSVDGPGFPVSLEVNFTDPGFTSNPGAAGLAYTKVETDGTISRARIVYRSLQIVGFWHSEINFEVSIIHEVIHTTGLNHSSTEDPPGIMSGSTDSYQFRAPTEQERIIMKMQYERPPGTTLSGMTESDPGMSVQSAGTSEWHLVCAR